MENRKEDARQATRTTGLILAGGRSRRMQGNDKALLALRGKPLLTYTLQRLAPQVDRLAISSNAAAETLAAFPLPVLADVLPGYLGPLAGIHAGLRQYPDDFLVTVAVDVPFLPSDLVGRLKAGLGRARCAYVTNGEQHALAILWAPGMAGEVESYLKSGGRRLKDFLAAHGQAVVFDQPRDRGLFININTPEELARVERDPGVI